MYVIWRHGTWHDAKWWHGKSRYDTMIVAYDTSYRSIPYTWTLQANTHLAARIIWRLMGRCPRASRHSQWSWEVSRDCWNLESTPWTRIFSAQNTVFFLDLTLFLHLFLFELLIILILGKMMISVTNINERNFGDTLLQTTIRWMWKTNFQAGKSVFPTSM